MKCRFYEENKKTMYQNFGYTVLYEGCRFIIIYLIKEISFSDNPLRIETNLKRL